ncbi:hypothetical protein D7X74_18755 [Corallococcus sp. CA047B]|uniref:immunity 52 family protein n=1 Tax=Corallococcus sp. CA047B TaxID=2316729 RepID=UPI000EA3F937|nr:immunity 52 family protein [Corallococcus sp. CA047B]RKH15249.1 hypothetical protein D7X74_18755 [Corallococcus sp. CA047B]
MNETYYAGVYWPSRGESPEACALRAEALFGQLASLDPTLSPWFEQANSRAAALKSQFVPDEKSFIELFKKKKYQTAPGEIAFSAWNGEKEASSVVELSCGPPSAHTVDVCLFRPPARGAAAERLLSSVAVARALRAMALAWNPEFGIATSHVHRDEVLKLKEAGTFVGWVMYLSHQRGQVPALPAPVQVEPVANQGTLIVLTPERFTASNPDHRALAGQVQELLDDAGLLKPVTGRPSR